MAKKFIKTGSGISLGLNSSAPLDPQNGDIYYDNTLGVFRFYQDGQWVNQGEGGSGDASTTLETLKNQFIDSPYKLLTPNIFSSDDDTKVDIASTGSIVNDAFELASGENLVSTQMLDADEFLSLGKNLDSVGLTVFWKADAIDDAADYEVSRNGGAEWQVVTMTRVGEATETYFGNHEFDAEASNQQLIDNSTTLDSGADLDASNIKLAQSFILTETSILRSVEINVTKTGTPAGNIFVQIVADNSSLPSNTLLYTSPAIVANSLINGDNTLNISELVLPANTYHVVFSSDATYKASAGSNYLTINGNTTAGGSSFFNGSAWFDSGTESFQTIIEGIELDLRVKVTASQNSVALIGYGIFYDNDPVTVVGNTLQLQVFKFKAVADNLNSFTLTNFLPNADLLKVYYVEGGQVFHYGAFSLQGQTVLFPTNTFNNNNVEADITLVFDQMRGGAYDNADVNASLLTANHLGSTDASIDRSVAGRGIFLRRPDGTLRELVINDADEIEIYSV